MTIDCITLIDKIYRNLSYDREALSVDQVLEHLNKLNFTVSLKSSGVKFIVEVRCFSPPSFQPLEVCDNCKLDI